MATFVFPQTPVDTTGLATEAKQDSAITELQAINTELDTISAKDFSTETTLAALNAKVTTCDTGNVTVVSSALPTGAATESTLSTLNGKVTAVDTGNVTVASSALPTGAATEASLATVAGDTTSLDAKMPAQGAALTAASTPVNIASDQVVPVSATSLPLPTGAATESTLSTLNGKVTTVDTGNVTVASSALPTGAATETTLSALNTKVTAVDTGNVTVSSSALPTGAATETTLSTLNGKVTACDTSNVTIASSALPTGAATAANQASILAELQRIETKTPVDFLDSGLVDSSSTNITTAGTQVVASLAADCSELEIQEDIGEFMALTDGADAILAYLPLGGGRVKVSIASGTTLKLASLTGSAITLGSIAINFLD